MLKMPLKNESGFTLLELLVVIAILTTMAYMSLGSVVNDTSRIRYEDTNTRLEAIRTAVVGSSSQKLWEKGLVGGYVVDNGRLPVDINSLIRIPTDSSDNEIYEGFGLLPPVFDPTPHSNGYDNNSGDKKVLTSSKHRLMKGHRGAYIHGARNNAYRDGWGNQTNPGDATMDCPSNPGSAGSNHGSDLYTDNFGWCVTLVDSDSDNKYGKFDDLYIDSYGVDGQEDQLTGDAYETDTAMTGPVLYNDWQVDINTYSVRIVNESGSDINFSSDGLKVAMLIFTNDADLDGDVNDLGTDPDDPDDNYNCWFKVTSDAIPSAENCLDGDGIGSGGGACTDTTITETTATFNTSIKIPIGEHILVLVTDGANDISGDTDDELYPDTANAVFAKVKFFSRGGVPDMTLVIK